MLGLGVGLDDAGQGPVARLIRDGAVWAGDFRTQLYYADNEPVQIAGLFDLTNYRNSAAWRINTAGSLIAYAAGEPRVADGSLLVEEAATNLFLNSDSPATQTITISATGDYTLAVYGSGSVVIAANTATGTGFGTATNGSPVTVDITGTGTVDCTVTGSPTIVQLEADTVATSPIVTAATTVTRSAEVPLAKQGSGPEVVTNGGFDADLTGWSDDDVGSGVSSWSDGALRLNGSGSSDRAIRRQAISTVVGVTYRLQATGEATSGGPASVRLGSVTGGTDVLGDTFIDGSVSSDFTAVSTTTNIQLQSFTGVGGGDAVINNISIKRVLPYPNYTDDPGFLTATFKNVSDTGANRTVLSLSDGTTDEQVKVHVDASDDLILTANTAAGTPATATIASGIDLSAGGTVAVAYDGTNVRASYDGGAVATAAKVLDTSALMELHIACNEAGAEHLNGEIVSTDAGDGTLTDAQLQTKAQ